MHRKSLPILAALVIGLLHASAASAMADVRLCPGVWTYFSDPRAIVRGDTSFVGCISNRGNVVVASYNTRTGAVKRFTLRRRLGADDHNNPSIIARRDGRLMAFYSPHSGRTLPRRQRKAMYYRISKWPYSVSAWSKTRRVPLKRGCGLGFTYSNPIRLRGGHIFLAFRGACWHPTFTILNARTRRWSRPRQIIGHNKHRQYAKYAYDGRGGVDITYTKGHPHSVPSNVYYMKYRNGRFYRASGKLIGRARDLPFRVSRGDLVYNRATAGSGWVQDVATGPDGVPHIVLQAGKTKSKVTYRYASWNGRRWVSTFVAAGNLWNGKLVKTGHAFIAGGITLSHRDPSIVYLSRVVKRGNVIQLGRAGGGAGLSAMPDSNPNWQFRTIAGGSRRSCFRPVEGIGSSAAWTVFYFCGKHRGWSPGDFRTTVFGQLFQAGT